MELVLIWLVSSVTCVATFWWVLWGTVELKSKTWGDLIVAHLLLLAPMFNSFLVVLVVGATIVVWLGKKLNGKPFAHKNWREW